jgi:methylase of polypeptide subunit release factors
MTKQRKPPKSRLREKAARGPQPSLARYEKIIAKYLEEAAQLRGEPARSHRFSLLLGEVFADLEFPIITDYLAGLEKQISASESAKCRVSRGRPDALFGNVVVEFESELPAKYREAKRQLQKYVAILRKNPETRGISFIAIVTDGLTFKVLLPKSGQSLAPEAIGEAIELEEVESFDAQQRGPSDFYFWLDRYFCRRIPLPPKAEKFVDDFGTRSAAFREASAAWLAEAERLRNESDFKVVYENWRKYLRIAYGSAVGGLQLFVQHTYLASLAKLIAYVRITDAQAAPDETATQQIIEGTFFEQKGILNFLEEDFFSWVGRATVLKATLRIVPQLTSLLFTYNVRELSEDVMKELYQEIVGTEERHGLGEYYTPDWLAARMCARLLDAKGEDAVLDPACGSGTFLYQAIQHKKARLPHTRAALENILGNVVGIDIHPLAVIVSKMNVLLALGDLFEKRSGQISVQVYLANSIRHPEKESKIGRGAIAVKGVELNDHEVLIPQAVLESASSLDLAVRVADDFAKHHKEQAALDLPAFENYVRRRAPQLSTPPDVLQTLFDLSCTFHDFIRKPEDTIWAYILKNIFKPTFLTDKFDVLIGNPPWLSLRFVERGDYQDYLKRLIVRDHALVKGSGHLITHLELGTLFFVRCSRLYLKPQGRIGFVLPWSIFAADQHDRFRRSMSNGSATLTELWDLHEVAPLFRQAAAVAFGDIQSEIKKTLPGEMISGELPRKNATLAEAREHLKFEKTEFHLLQQGERTYFSTSRKKISSARSYYQPYFKEGATIVPRNFWFVQFKPDPRLGIDPQEPLVSTDPRAEAEAKPPYKGVKFEGKIEAEFLHATLLSTDLLPFGHFHFRPVVLPLLSDAHGYRLLSAEQARREGFLNLANWLGHAQEVWHRLRKEKAKRGDISSWLNYRNKLTEQDPRAKYVVLYPMSATYLCAAAVSKKGPNFTIAGQDIESAGVLADYVNFYFETNNHHEAQYLAGILNAPCIDAMVKPMQAKGLWGPRHLCKKVLELPIPEFKASDRKHMTLARMAEECAESVRDMLPGLHEQIAGLRGPHAIGRARSTVRTALKEELAEIDSLVKDILK